jgi:hypothetical protein
MAMSRLAVLVATAASLLFSSACGATGGASDAVADTRQDAGDASEEAADAQGDTAGDAAEADTGGEACQAGAVPHVVPDPAVTKYALSMFHFNVQYVAGGLVTEWDGKPLTLCDEINEFRAQLFPPGACDGWDDARLSEWEVDVAFEPTLDLFLKHPDWKATFEIPGIMLEVIADRRPAVLDKLRAAAWAGQIELVSFHWSAQLFEVLPRDDLERSLAMTRKVFADNCLPLSAVVFDQEGQTGEGKHAFMAAHDQAIDVMHVNQFGYVHFGVPLWPYYASRGVTVVVGPPGKDGNAGIDPASGIDVRWTFFDDGELLSAPADPYFAPVIAEADAISLSTFEKKVSNWVAEGFKVTTLTDFVASLEARGVPKPDLPPIIDGTWQPLDTDGIHLWMGRRGRFTWATHERDNLVRTTNVNVGFDLKAAEVLVATAAASGYAVPDADARLDTAWRALLRAEVSDATGINPFQGEFVYARDNHEAARTAAASMTADALAALGWPHAEVDLAAGTASRLEGLPMTPVLPEVAAPFAVTVDAPTRTAQTRWHDAGKDRYVLDVMFGPTADPTDLAVERCRVTATFPRHEDRLLFTPPLIEDEVVDRSFADFQLHPDADYPSGSRDVYLPLANGLIGLGGGWWVVRDDTTCMIAARVPIATPTVEFIDETADPAAAQTWRFHVLKGAQAEALQVATRVNVHPAVWK